MMKHGKADSSSEEMTLQTIKKQLGDMGLSTATEGLIGDDRYEELKHRLLKAKGMVSERLSSSSSSSSNYNVPSSPLSQLTIGEIRSRLTDLGESTSTPGLVGEERRIELMRRLTMSICGTDTDESNAIIDDMIDRKMMKANDDKMELISKVVSKAPDPPAPTSITAQTIEDTDGVDRNGLDITITNGDISEIKKTLKRILNKRAIAVAARLSGTNQDPDLKEHEKNSSKAEAELARLRVQKQQSSSTTISSSSILVDGGNKMSIDKLIQKLENLKVESKEQIRIIRLRIREEVDQHHEYGTAAEEELQAALRHANYTKGRTRRKIDEIKAMNTGKSVKGSNDEGDKNDDKTKPVQMKESLPVKSKNVNLPPTKVKSMENGLDSRWDNLEALGNKQKREFEELMADLGHEDDLFDLRGLSDEILKPKDMPPSAKEPERKVLAKPVSNIAVTPAINDTKIATNDYRNKASALPPTKIIDYNDEGEDEDDENDDNDDDDGSDDEDGEEETVTHYSPPPTAEPVLKEKPSLIKRLLEEQEKERQAMILKRNELQISTASDDNDDDNDDKYDPDMKYISNIYENLQPVPLTAPTSPKSLGNTNPSSSRSNVVSPRSPRTETTSLSSKMISPVDTNTSSIIEKRKPPPPNQPPSNRSPQSPAAKSSRKPELTVDTFRPITASENVSRPQTAPATPKTPLGGNSKFAKSKEDADMKVQSPKTTTNAAAHDSEDDDDEDDDDEADGDNREQVKTLLKHAKVLEGLGDLVSAESMYARALELNPLDVSSLNSYAVFLHNKRGELTRAESFFGRAIHTIFPGLYETVCTPNPDKIPRPPPVFDLNDDKHINELKDKPALTKTKYKVVVNCLLNYAGFLSRAKGDIESAQFVYSKALQIASNDAKVLGIVAHFLAEEGGNSKKAAEIFARAMKLDPNNAKHAMYYAKVLKKQGKSGQAELMYMVALQKSQGDRKIEPTAICNYATYIFKHKKDKVKAQQMFIEGLEKYPGHKGLVKNYSTLLKANPNMGSSESLRQPTPMSAKSRLRVDSAIKAAMDRIQSPIPVSSSGPVLSRASSSSAFTFMATGFDASRVTTPDIVELKKVVNRKLTPHAANRKTLAGTAAAFDDYDDGADYSIASRGMKLESDLSNVVVESNLSNVKDSWIFENNNFFSGNSPGHEESDDDSDEDLYNAPISPSKKK